MAKGISSYLISVMNEFKSDADLVDGRYAVRLIETETRLAYHERAFFLSDCEAKFTTTSMPKLTTDIP